MTTNNVTKKPFQLGSVSTGTLRPEDLLLAFGNALEQFEGITIPAAIDGYQDGGTSYQDAELLILYTELLESMCPPFVTFGPHPGDPADFGFWPDWDALHDECRDPVFTLIDDEVWCSPRDTPVLILFRRPNNHGKFDAVTVMDLDRNVFWTTS